MLLLHGIQGTASVWSKVADALSQRRLVCAPNMWGRANSASPRTADAFSLEAFAAAVRCVFETMPKPVLLVGWSMGVLVALAYLERFGEDDVEGLVLASGTPRPANEAVWFRGETLREIEEEAQARAQRLKLAACATPAAVAGSWMSARNADFGAVLGKVTHPTLVVHGDRDEECPVSHARLMADAIGGARLDVWPGHGHNLMIEDPERFAQAIEKLAATYSADRLAANQ